MNRKTKQPPAEVGGCLVLLFFYLFQKVTPYIFFSPAVAACNIKNNLFFMY
jgi:hypothetical protein